MTNDFFETVPYNHQALPIYIRKETFLAARNSASHINWHNDIELVKVISGSIKYSINGEIFKLREGECLFINANQIHYNFCCEDEDCVFICLVLHPAFLCAKKRFEEKYVVPLMSNTSLTHYIMKNREPWEKTVSSCIQNIYDSCSDSDFELTLHACFFTIWSHLYKNLSTKMRVTNANNESVTSFRNMLSYIQNHYKEKVDLKDICAAGNVCKTTCNKIFTTYTGRTPIGYLTDYRLQKAVSIMKNEDLTLTQVCYECGFSSASYFAETFKKVFGVSPKKYINS